MWQQGYRGGWGQLRKHASTTVEAHTIAHVPPGVWLKALPSDRLLAPGADNRAIPLAGLGLVRLMQDLLGRGDERARVLDQPATAVELGTVDGEHSTHDRSP